MQKRRKVRENTAVGNNSCTFNNSDIFRPRAAPRLASYRCILESKYQCCTWIIVNLSFICYWNRPWNILITASVCSSSAQIFQKNLEPLQNSGGQNSDMKQVPCRGPTNIRQPTKRFSRGRRVGDLGTRALWTPRVKVKVSRTFHSCHLCLPVWISNYVGRHTFKILQDTLLAYLKFKAKIAVIVWHATQFFNKIFYEVIIRT